MRATFDLIEAGAERGNATAARALEFISATIGGAFDAARLHDMPRLDGSDSCERVAEALAVWLKESAPRAFADMTGTRYAVTGLDCSAEGMERLRDQCERILIVYPSGDESADDIAAEFVRDMDSSDQGDGFDYDAAESAIRAYIAEIHESGYLGAKLAEFASYHSGNNPAGLPTDDYDAEPAPMRLYLRDNAPESD